MFYDGSNKLSDSEDITHSNRGMDFLDAKPSGPSHTERSVDDGNSKMKKRTSKKDKGKEKGSARDKHFREPTAKKTADPSFNSPTPTERRHREIEFSPSSPESSEPETFWQEAVPEADSLPRSPPRDPSGSFRRGPGSKSSGDETSFNGRNCPLSPPKLPSRSISPNPNKGASGAIILNTFVEDDNDGRSSSDRDDLTISTDEAKELCRGSDDEDGNVLESDHESRHASTDSRTFSSETTFDEAFTTGSERSSSSAYEENSLAGSSSESGDSSYEERSIREMEEGRNENDMVYREMDPQQKRKMTLTLVAVIISWCLVGVIAGGIVGTILKG